MRLKSWNADRFRRLLIITPVVVIAAGVCFAGWSRHQQSVCDSLAEKDVALGALCIERFRSELIDLGCSKLWNQFTAEHLLYLVGPYYGWRGSSRRSLTLIRLEGRILCGCSPIGRPAGKNGNDRYIYRANMDKGEILEPLVGKCEGKFYGSLPDKIYLSSMVGDDGKCPPRLHEPSLFAPMDRAHGVYQ